jgi:hypothetical protein
MRIGRGEVIFAAMMALVLTGVAVLFAPAPTWGGALGACAVLTLGTLGLGAIFGGGR